MGLTARVPTDVNTTIPFYKSEQPNILTLINWRGGGAIAMLVGQRGGTTWPCMRQLSCVQHSVCVLMRPLFGHPLIPTTITISSLPLPFIHVRKFGCSDL